MHIQNIDTDLEEVFLVLKKQQRLSRDYASRRQLSLLSVCVFTITLYCSFLNYLLETQLLLLK